MSIAALNWAWTQEPSNATAKLVLLALADKANEEGECWPGMDTVARMAGVSSRQVLTHLATLEDAGLLTRRRNRSALGRLGKTVYHLTLATGSTLHVDHVKSTSGSQLPVDAPDHVKSSVVDHVKPASSLKASHKEQPSEEPSKPAKTKPSSPRGTRLPDGWRPSPEPELVAELGGQDAAKREWAKFVDFWRAKPGKDGRKVDWQATWRNWLRNATERRGTNGRVKPRQDSVAARYGESAR